MTGLTKRLLQFNLGEADIHDAERLADEIVKQLGTPPRATAEVAERMRALRMLGFMFPAIAEAYRPFAETLLDRTDDVWLVEMGLSTLLQWFGPASYVEMLVECLLENEWDPLHELWPKAASAAGEYLRTHTEPRLLAHLIELVGDTNEDVVMRAVAYAAIHTALGYEPELSWMAAKPMLDHPDVGMLAAARERLEREATES